MPGFAGHDVGTPLPKLLALWGVWAYCAATQQRTCLCHASLVVTQRRQAFWQHYRETGSGWFVGPFCNPCPPPDQAGF